MKNNSKIDIVGWEELSLGEVTTSITDGTHTTPKYTNSGIKFLSVENITSKNFINTKYISLEDHKINTKRCSPKKGDILMTRIGSIGDTALVDWDEDFSIYVSLALLKPNNKLIDTNYLYQYTKSYDFFRDTIKRSLTWAAPQKINLGDISDIKVLFPSSIQEQKKIAQILSTWDEAIETIDSLINKKKKLFLSLSYKLLHQSGNYPKKKLKDVADFQNGKAHEKLVEKNGEYTLVNSKFISTNGKVFKLVKQNLLPLQVGDVAIVMSDVPNGKALAKCFYVDKNEKYALNQRVGRVRARENKMDSKYLYYYLNRNNYYLRFNNGVSQTNLRTAQVFNCPILVPPMEKQKEISEIISNLDDEIKLLTTKKKLFIQQKKGLMQRLLTGKVRVN